MIDEAQKEVEKLKSKNLSSSSNYNSMFEIFETRLKAIERKQSVAVE